MARVNVPYLQWRDGRPRWEPGPALRARGFKGRDLKDAHGQWLGEGDAIAAARALNAATEAPGTALRPVPGAGTIHALSAAWQAAPTFKALGDRTREAYEYHLRLIDEHMGDIPVAAVSRKAIRDFHAALAAERGLATANAVMRTLRAMLYFGMDELEWPGLTKNRAARLDLPSPDGRCVVHTPDEIAAQITAADELGFPCIGDAIALAVMSCLRRADVLTAPEGDLTASSSEAVGQKTGAAYILKTRKTGALVRIPVVPLLLNRIRDARAHKAKRWPNVAFKTEIVASDSGEAYAPEGSLFRKRYEAVRCNAAFVTPDVAEKRFADFRDTGITWLARAGCNKFEIASITGHSLATIDAVLEKHYLVLDTSMSDAAGVKLVAWMAKEGMG